jgi:hypothetical protein
LATVSDAKDHVITLPCTEVKTVPALLRISFIPEALQPDPFPSVLRKTGIVQYVNDMSLTGPPSGRKDRGRGNTSDATRQEIADDPHSSRSRGRRQARSSRGAGSESRRDDEAQLWVSRLKQLQDSATSLDRQFDKCLSLVDRKPCSSKREPLYRFGDEDFKDPYPQLTKHASGRGYILPPFHKITRKRFPLCKSDFCYPAPDFVAELHESERRLRAYVPGQPATRGDSMRWRFRERMHYSHPDYNT